MFFADNLKRFKNIKHCFFSRKNGVSSGIYSSLNCGFGSKDEKNNISKNLSIVTSHLGVAENSLMLMNQTHSNIALNVKNINNKDTRIMSDAIITDSKDISLGVLTADCVPILFFDEVNNVVACAHAGWKGAFNGIIENTLNSMLENYKNSKIHIAVGPCIDADSYEVGLEFKDKFIKKNKTFEKFFNNKDTNKIHFDLREFVNSKFKKFQRNIESIENVKHDTFKDAKNFFSYRRSTKIGENDYGRCISVIALI